MACLLSLALGGPLGLLPTERWFGVTASGLALALITFGLLSSTLHLGHPERAWRAVQPVALLLAVARGCAGADHLRAGARLRRRLGALRARRRLARAFGLIAALARATVYCTA